MPTRTILEPLALDGERDVSSPGFDDAASLTTSDKEEIIKKPKTVPKLWKWRLEGMTIVVLSVLVLSAALTLALLISILVGDPQVKPHGAVVAENDYCSSIGLQIMQKHGGNAVDAAVSTALCLAVVRPDVASLAGCGLMLIRDRNLQTSHLFDFMCTAPSNATEPDLNKPFTLTGIPGLVRGLYKVQIRFGKKMWNELFTGAVQAIQNGFRPDTALLNAAKFVKQSNPGLSSPIVDGIISAASATYLPPAQLAHTFRQLSSVKPTYFSDSTEPDTFQGQLLKYMNANGQNWAADDFRNYTVHERKPLETEFAGFTLEAFPAPASGGPFLISLLSNLDMLNTVRPLSSPALQKNDPEETALLLHRLVELSRFSEHAAANLGDIADPSIRDVAAKAENKMFSTAERQSVIQAINDSHTAPLNLSASRLSESNLGDTGIVVTDSVRLTVVMTLFLGSPFGSGQVLPDTGIHLNSALRLFSSKQGVPANTSVLNTIATGRRPLFPSSPIYMVATHRKCGVRFGLASSGGFWGLFDAAQVISYAALFLRGSTCHVLSTANLPAATVDSNQLLVSKTMETASRAASRYTPAVDHGCLDMQSATNLARLHSGLLTHSATNKTLALFLESLFEKDLANHLLRLGHDIRNETGLWPGRVVSAGWNGYDMVTSLDNRGSWKLRTY